MIISIRGLEHIIMEIRLMKTHFPAILPFLLLLLFTSCSSDETQRPLLIVSGNNRLSLEPCGCNIPVGGLARKINFIDEIRTNSPLSDVFVIEAGNWLFHKAVHVHPREVPYLKELTEIQLQAYSNVPYNVINVGHIDLALGLDYLSEIQQKYDLPFISANIMDEKGERPFPSHIFLKSGHKKILVTGVISDPPDIHGGIVLRDPLRALNNEIAPLIGSYDFCVVLVDGPELLAQEVDKQIRGVDLVIDTRTVKQTLSSSEQNLTSSATLGMEGRYIGLIELKLSKSEKARDLSQVQRRLDFVNERLENLENKVPFGVEVKEHYRDNPNILKQLDKYKIDLVEQQAQLDSVPNWFSWNIISLTADYEGNPDIDPILNAKKREFADKGLGMPKPSYK